MKFELTLTMTKEEQTKVLWHDRIVSSDLIELLSRLPLLVIRLRKTYDEYSKPNILTDDDISF